MGKFYEENCFCWTISRLSSWLLNFRVLARFLSTSDYFSGLDTFWTRGSSGARIFNEHILIHDLYCLNTRNFVYCWALSIKQSCCSFTLLWKFLTFHFDISDLGNLTICMLCWRHQNLLGVFNENGWEGNML